jgi:hypothetical protein
VNDFWVLWNFPNYIGAIDGKHAWVQAPPNSSFSVVHLTLVGARYNFTVVDIGSYGRNGDGGGGIFAHSKVGKYLENHLDIPEDKQIPECHAEPLILLWVTRLFFWKPAY